VGCLGSIWTFLFRDFVSRRGAEAQRVEGGTLALSGRLCQRLRSVPGGKGAGGRESSISPAS
jgi:hypothetical protein